MVLNENVTAISAGGGHSLFLKTDRSVWATGYNYYGQLGDGATANQSTPIQVTSLGFGMWGPWEIVDAAGNVDTGAWMGFVNVALDPWVYSYSLNQWLYIDSGSITESGSWVYIFNF